MIKEVLQQLEPLDAQIDALCSRADDAEMANTTAHLSQLMGSSVNIVMRASWILNFSTSLAMPVYLLCPSYDIPWRSAS